MFSGPRVLSRHVVTCPLAVLGALALLLGGTATAARAATPTSVVVSVNLGSGLACEAVVLSAAVDPATSGTVQFSAGTAPLGDPVPVDATGFASRSTILTAGDHAITADFNPTDTAAWIGSTSTSPAFRLEPCPTSSTDPQAISADIAAGELKVTTPYTPENPIILGPLILNPSATSYGRDVAVTGIAVVDTRAGARPWTLTALAGDLISGTHRIDAQNVGFVDVHEVAHVGPGIVTTFANPSANPPVVAGTPGALGIGRTPKTTAQGTGPGSSELAGRLTLSAPTSTRAGRYTGTFTLTIV